MGNMKNAPRLNAKCAKNQQEERGRENCNFLTPLSSMPRPFYQREEERPETWLGQDFFSCRLATRGNCNYTEQVIKLVHKN
jgi:hypothetical protein